MSKKRTPRRARKGAARKPLSERRAKKEVKDILGSLEEGRATLENVEALLKGQIPTREDVTGTFEKFFGEFRGLDLRAEIEKARAPQERAVQLVLEAVLADNDDDREDFARRALGEHAGNADAWRILAGLSDDADVVEDHLHKAVEAGREAIGDGEPSAEDPAHRPWFRARAALDAFLADPPDDHTSD